MILTTQLAKHFRDVHFGGNWTCSNLRETLDGITWQQATTKIDSLNTIATLVFHIHYFIAVALEVLKGNPLKGSDKLSFDHPPLHSAADWEGMQDKVWADVHQFAALVEQLPEERLWEVFGDEKYGNYYRNIAGIIEHTHYHLGQIALLKKMVQQAEQADLSVNA